MSEDKPTEKTVRIKNKRCPMCNKYFVYSCIKCNFFDEILGRYFLNHIKRGPSSSYECNKSSNFVVLYLDGLVIFKIDPKEIPPPNSIDTNHASKTNSLPISARNESSSSSVKLRKSSNIFSSLVKKARRKKTPNKNGNDGIKNLHISSQNLSCASTLSLGVHVEEVELSCQNYDKKCSQNRELYWEEKGVCSETNTSNHSLARFIKHPKKDFGLPGTQCCSQNFKNNLVQTSQLQLIDHNNFNGSKAVVVDHIVEENCEEDTAISSFVTFQKLTLDVSLADGLQYVQETVTSLHESENHIIGLLNKYIKDPGLQKQLLDAVSRHSRHQWDAERRSCSLANDMWMQQLEIGRAQEKILQGTLTSLLKQNRHLQIENENLYRKHEKAVKMLKGVEYRSNRCQEHDAQIDSVLRHNEKLQVKLETVFKKCESLEGELGIFQKQNDSMELQLRNSTVKMQNMKALIYKMKTEYELEQTALNFKLETKEQILKEALDAGDILLEDLDALKRQQKNMPFGLNWSKFKVRGSCLTDLIHMCRSCINELSKEILTTHNDIALKEKDISSLRETNTKLQESVKKSATEMDIMSRKIEENVSATTARLLNEQKCRIMENEVRALEDKIEGLKGQIDAEKALKKQSNAEFENYKKEVQEKDKTIEQTRLVVANVTTENCTLKSDIAVLSQLLKETGAGDVVREMENSQQEIEYYHKELQKLQQENHGLITELGTARNENGVLKANQETTYKNLQKQNRELERMCEEIHTTRQKFDVEHQTVLSLQSERKKYLEEKNLLKSIVQHLKNELAKIKLLEENLANVTKEASKLGLVAEYNKQQGEKLKKEVIQRESVIAQLKTNVNKLNELHMQNAKEKLSLCYELNEVCQLKEKLSEVLNTEVKKNEELGQSKEAIVKSVTNQIQKIEEKQKNERTAIRVLLKDIKIIAEEKEQVAKEKDKLQLETDQLAKEIAKKEQENGELRKDRDHFEKKLNEINESLKKEQSMYELNLKQLKKLIEQLRNDKKELQSSNEYLKNNIEKLHKDLNISRHNEKTVADILNKTKRQQEEMQKALNNQTESVKNLTREKEKLVEEKMKLVDEKEKLIKEINYLNTIMDKVVNDFEKSIKTSEEKERLFKSEFDESTKLVHTYAQEIQHLNNTIDLKEKQIEELSEMANDEQFNQKRYLQLKEEIDHLETEYSNLKETKTDLENQLSDLQAEYDKSTEHQKTVEKEMLVLENQLKIVLDQKEEDYVFYKKHIAELLRTREEIESQNQKEVHTVKQQLQDANNKMVNEKAAYETLSQIHKEVSGKFMKSIKDLVDSKNSKQEIEDKLKESEERIKEMENGKEDLNKQMNQLADELEMTKHAVIQLNEENNLLQKSYNKALDKCVSLEYEIKRIELDHHQEVKELEKENSKKELEETETILHKLKTEISALRQEITVLQIDRSEITLELHETKKKLETEKNLSEQLKNTHKLLLAAVLQLKEAGKVDPCDCIHLLHMVRSSSSMAADDAAEKL